MNNLSTFESCCEYLGISSELPKCEVDQKQTQAAYKLRVCMRAWNKQDGFEPDEKANYYQEGVGYTPHFNYKDGRLLRCGDAYYSSYAGLIDVHENIMAIAVGSHIGLRLSLKTTERAIEFGKTFIDIFNELI